MAQPSKFSGALSRLREPQPEEMREPPTVIAAAPAATPEPMAKGRGRPPGKRSDPDFKPTTVFLRNQTKRAAVRQLEDRDDNRDLSELVEDLLSQWLKEPT